MRVAGCPPVECGVADVRSGDRDDGLREFAGSSVTTAEEGDVPTASGRSRVNKDAVVQAALRVVDRDGFAALTLASVAALLDRDPSSLYKHVPGLDALRGEVTLHCLHELSDDLMRAALGRGRAEGLRAIARTYQEFAARRRGRFDAATSWRLLAERDDPRFDKAMSGGEAAIYAVIASFGLGEEEVVHASRSFTSAVIGFVQARNRLFSETPPTEETFDYLIGMFERDLSRP